MNEPRRVVAAPRPLRPLSPSRASRAPRAPAHLSPSSKALWAAVTRSYNLEEHQLRVLALACEALDRATEAREAVTRDGILIVSAAGGKRAHPLITVERDARLSAARLLREVGLDLQDPDQAGPPSRYHGAR